MWNLIRLFPLSFGDHRDIWRNRVWNLCTSFCHVVERLCALTFTRRDFVIFQFFIDNFLERYVSLLLEAKSSLRHYLEMIGHLGY